MADPEGIQLQLPNLPLAAEPRRSRLELATRWVRSKLLGRGDNSIKDMIKEALEEDSAAPAPSISAEEKELLKNIVHFGELTVRDVMIPRTEILAVPRHVSIEELNRYVVEIGHTRIPVYDESLDKIEGFIHVKDLFIHEHANTSFDLGKVLREILFVPPSMRIVDLMLKMRVSGCHMAIVVDEYGGTSGLATMEDLFEELVGEIQDEHDEAHTAASMMRWVGDVLEADARVKIDALEEALGERLHSAGTEASDYDTLGGFIFFTLGRVPVKGEVLKVRERLKIEVTIADPRRVRMVRISRLVQPAAAA